MSPDELADSSDGAGHPRQSSLVGQVISDRYEIMEPVGAGGMAQVFKARHVLMQKAVAFKVLREQLADNETARKRFLQEAQAVSHLSHQNVVTIYDFGFLADGRSFIVMDFIDGQTLSSLIDDAGGLPLARSIELMLQICDGVQHAHDSGLVHRDLKPNNIIVLRMPGGKEQVKILDFGLAKLMPDFSLGGQRLTQTGEYFGTALYMSPEQCSGKTVDKVSDVYALGCILYEMITGLPPHVGDNPLDTMQMHINSPAPPLSSLRPDLDIPDALEGIVAGCLVKDPKARTPSAAELASELLALGQDAAAGAGRVSVVAKWENQSDSSERAQTQPVSPDETSGLPKTEAPSQSKGPGLLVPVAAGLVAIAAVAATTLSLKPKPPDLKVSATAAGTGRNWQVFDKQGNTAFEKSDYPAAEKFYNLAVIHLQRAGGDPKQLVAELRKVSDVYNLEGKYELADSAEKQARKFERQSVVTAPAPETPGRGDSLVEKTEDKEVVDRLASLAKVCHQGGDCDRAENLLKRSLAISQKAFGADSPQARKQLDDLAAFYISIDEPAKAQQILKTFDGVHK